MPSLVTVEDVAVTAMLLVETAPNAIGPVALALRFWIVTETLMIGWVGGVRYRGA